MPYKDPNDPKRIAYAKAYYKEYWKKNKEELTKKRRGYLKKYYENKKSNNLQNQGQF